MMRRLYILLGLLIIGGYAYADWRGLELRRRETHVAPAGVRGAHGGGYVFWYSGYRGGK